MQSRAGDLLVISLMQPGDGFSLVADADATQTSETRADQDDIRSATDAGSPPAVGGTCARLHRDVETAGKRARRLLAELVGVYTSLLRTWAVDKAPRRPYTNKNPRWTRPSAADHQACCTVRPADAPRRPGTSKRPITSQADSAT